MLKCVRRWYTYLLQSFLLIPYCHFTYIWEIVLITLQTSKWHIILTKIFLEIRYHKCCNMIQLISEKELILLKLTTANNVWFAIISFLIVDLNFKILHARLSWHSNVNISDIAIITIKNVDYCCIIYYISKSETINLLKSSAIENRRHI